jgi:hypothetical protein
VPPRIGPILRAAVSVPRDRAPSLASVRQCYPAETTGVWTVTGSA